MTIIHGSAHIIVPFFRDYLQLYITSVYCVWNLLVYILRIRATNTWYVMKGTRKIRIRFPLWHLGTHELLSMQRDHRNSKTAFIMLRRHKITNLSWPERWAVFKNHVHVRWSIDLIIFKAPVLPLNGGPKHSVDLACATRRTLPGTDTSDAIDAGPGPLDRHKSAIRINH